MAELCATCLLSSRQLANVDKVQVVHPSCSVASSGVQGVCVCVLTLHGED